LFFCTVESHSCIPRKDSGSTFLWERSRLKRTRSSAQRKSRSKNEHRSASARPKT
jgi:hypothetical protein